MKYRLISALLIHGIITVSLLAQTADFGVWSTVGIEKTMGKWDLNAEYELRTKDNSTQINRWSIKIEPSYHLFKLLQVGAAYEFIYFHDTRYLDYQPRHRGYAFAQGKYKIGRFSFSLRERLQVTKKDDSDRIKASGTLNTYRINPEWTWRNRIKIAYDVPKIPVKPSISLESFYPLNNSGGNTFDKLRYTLSFSYNLTKHHRFEVYGLLDKDINVSDPVHTYIFGIGYGFSI
jgi:hypothetical protein